MAILEKGFLYLAIASAIMLVYGITIYILREKLSTARKQPVDLNLKIIESVKRAISLLKVFLWLSLLFVIIVPWVCSKHLNINGIIVFACMALIEANALINYINQKWYYQFLLKLAKS